MSASPHNSGYGFASDMAGPHLAIAPPSPAQTEAPEHEALQALLAFSALHEQIRERKLHPESHLYKDDWKLERFVLDEVLHLVSQRALNITQADGVAIALAEEAEGNAIICRASVGMIVPGPGVRLDLNSGFSGACFRTGKIIRCDNSEADARVNVYACRRLGARSMVAVPLIGRKSVVGMLEAFSSRPYSFTDSHVRSLSLLAELIVAALKPEEEDYLAEISRQAIEQAASQVCEKMPVVAPSAPVVAPIAPIVVPIAPDVIPLIPRPAPQRITQWPWMPKAGPQESEPEVSQLEAPLLFANYQATTSSRPGLGIVFCMVLLAVALGTGVWWKVDHRAQVTASKTAQPTLAIPPQPIAAVAVTQPEEVLIPAVKSAGRPEVMGLRHWSSTDSSTIVVDLQDQVHYEAHRISGPERIYFDLDQTTLAPGWFGKSINIQDPLLSKVRIAQPAKGITRVVLDTKGTPDFSVRLEQSPPRLVVEVQRPGAPLQARAKTDLFEPVQPVSTQSRTVASAFNPESVQPRSRTPKFRIVLDAGHGGWDLGTVGRKGLLEKDLVLDIAGRLGKLVENRLGGQVLFTRNDDTYISLERRAEIANLWQADLFLSIHANYSNSPDARGVETYYTSIFSSEHSHTPEAATLQNAAWNKVDIPEKAEGSKKFAANVQRALYGTLLGSNPAIVNRGVKEASYVVLTGTTMPAVLAEVSFVSSPTDETKLESPSYRQRIAEALYKGIARYTEETRRVKMASTSAAKSAAR